MLLTNCTKRCNHPGVEGMPLLTIRIINIMIAEPEVSTPLIHLQMPAIGHHTQPVYTKGTAQGVVQASRSRKQYVDIKRKSVCS
jgi:hypothetical protein